MEHKYRNALTKSGTTGKQANPSASTNTRLEVKNVTGLPSDRRGFSLRGLFKTTKKYYLAISVGETVHRTHATSAKGDEVRWGQEFFFPALNDSTVTFRLYVHQSKSKMDDPLGVFVVHLAALLSRTPDVDSRYITCDLNNSQKLSLKILIAIKLDVSSTAQMDSAVTRANEGGKVLPGQLPATMGAMSEMISINAAAKMESDFVSAWETLLDKLDVFVKLMDGFAEVHPYAKIASLVLFSACKVFIGQRKRDARVFQLLQTMNDVYDFIIEANPTAHISSQQTVLKCMAQQTIECGHFISTYTKDRNFVMKAGKYLFSGIDAAIQEYKEKFDDLLTAFNTKGSLRTEIVVLDIATEIADLGVEVDLIDMPYAKGAGFRSGRQCLPGTRVNILEKITQWVTNLDDKRRVCILAGPAGTGKSSIAHTIAQMFDELGRLGSSFCFDRNNLAKRQSKLVFPTLARDLAGRDPVVKMALGNIIHNNPSIRNTEDLQNQYRKIILASTSQLSMTGPVVIVIDAIDESGDVRTRREFLRLLAKDLQELPDNFRFFITSRMEEDIIQLFTDNPNIFFIPMPHALDDASIRDDIVTYISAQLVDTRGQLQDLGDARCLELAKRSEGLFQWADVACDFIKGDGKGGLSPLERYERLILHIDTGNGRSTTLPLDNLYGTVLSEVLNADDEEVMDRFRSIVGLILVAYEPLSASSLKQLLQHESGHNANAAINEVDSNESEYDVTMVLKYLGSLLSGVAGDDELVRPLHTSFRDYLTDRKRSEVFYVELSLDFHWRLLCYSLALMKKHLRFNICGLETSYLYTDHRNKELRSQVNQYIPEALQYACRFWGSHLSVLASSNSSVFPWQTLHRQLKEILYDKFLYWIEAISLLGQFDLAYRDLSTVIRMASNFDQDLVNFATDAQTFVKTFAFAISESVPHIYLSALPLTPPDSSIYKQYAVRYPRVCKISKASVNTKRTTQEIIGGHTMGVTSIAFSPDGKRVIAGFSNETLCLFDATTGGALLGLVRGHTDAISRSAATSLTFSPDGTRIVSGFANGTIRVWDAETGKKLSAPFQAHEWPVTSLTFSTDGRQIDSRSVDKTIILDLQTRDPISASMQGEEDHMCVVLSHRKEEERAVSRHRNAPIRILDIRHDRGVSCFAPSLDRKYIVSGYRDGTVRTWDAETNEKLLELFRGHISAVTSVAFSSDLKYVVSGSQDAIRIWDVDHAGESRPFQGHSAPGAMSKHVLEGERPIILGAQNRGMLPIVAFSSRREHALSATKHLYQGQSGDSAQAPLSPVHFDRTSNWIFGPQRELLLWIPEEYDNMLWVPRTTAILGGQPTELDLSQCAHGSNWNTCELL